MRIESGTLFCLDDTCFDKPPQESQVIAESKSDFNSSKINSSKIKNMKTNKKEKIKNSFDQLNQSDAKRVSVTSGATLLTGQADISLQSSFVSPESERPSYHIELVFTSSCIYLRLPLQDLKNALKEQDYETTVG